MPNRFVAALCGMVALLAFASPAHAYWEYGHESVARVAWEEMWQSFCDLALAGGPPHRGTLLEPVRVEDAIAKTKDYEAVLAEIERGIGLVAGLPIVRSSTLGWVGIECRDETMAIWMLRAIVTENVSVRRERAVVFLPVGPDFKLDQEIRNVITVVAKTHHYWSEHVLNAG